jgi:hypothetical protein
MKIRKRWLMEEIKMGINKCLIAESFNFFIKKAAGNPAAFS